MGHFEYAEGRRTVLSDGISPPEDIEGTTTMKILKAQVTRVLLALGAVAASGLVLEAGRRWNG
jgi:hypothetical protein